VKPPGTTGPPSLDPPADDRPSYSQEQLEELRYALDQAAIVAITDQRGLITYANDKFCEISGYSREELIGQDHRIINSAYHPPAFMRTLWRTIAHGQVWRGEIRNRSKVGEHYWVDTTIVPFVDDSGRPRQYLAIRYDITARKAAEAKLREQTALAQLGQLAAVVAHEVRNPLAGIRGSLQVIEGGLPRDAQERPVIGSIIRRIDQLSRSMEHLLLYARPQRPMLRPVPVSAVLAEVVMNTRAALGDACPDITIAGHEISLSADPDMLRAVLLNLLLNACQAGGRNPVHLETKSANGRGAIRILDRGPGLPSHIRERLFEPFVSARAGGTGLGLAIARRLTEAQGGTISLADRDGGGTQAELVFPLSRA
jgi:two-component system CheB/CheR fusion protein